MLIGYNTNVPYKGKQYHVQTEDGGTANPFVVTLLYYKGAILRSAKTSYQHLLGNPDFEVELRKIMKQQHREMIRQLITGKCDVNKPDVAEDPVAAPAAEPPVKIGSSPENVQKQVKSLDDILLEHITKKVKP